ncbi:DNA mismatch repair protein MutL [Halobacteriales archaeon QS_8_69_73]|nr:MAG: DNA mismatch repair protein MutL [Halobacteriales archaeon QS_8_69_73]
MSPDIRELDARTRDRIAAGEVVERPASVIKELVENALDADATRVDVAVETGGTDRIVVADDGVGMSDSEVRRAVEEHTTSKLRDVGDLEAIGTLGFRGEALHAIGSVSRMTIRTKPRGGSRGTELVVEEGEVVDRGPAGCPGGTTVEVTGLFGNVPARRKYLKTAATEFDHVQSVVAGYALAAPEVAVALEHDGRERFATAGDGDRRSAVLAVYGREVAASMIPVGDARPEGAADGPLAGVEGLVSHPETNRAGREYMTTLVDGRYVTADVVREAVVEAYRTQLGPDRYPFAVVDLDVPPGGVDVNVHPRKLEVLFADDEGVREQVRETVRSALLEAGLVRSRAPRGRSAPEQTEIDAGGGDGGRADDTGASDMSDVSDASGETAPADGDAGDTGGTAPADHEREPSRRKAGDATDRGRSPGSGGSDAMPSEPTSETGETDTRDGSDGRAAADAGGDVGAARGDDGPAFRAPSTQRTLDGDATTGTPDGLEQLPSMEVLGQFDETYLVAETDDGLLLVDQHAADERVNYERLQERFAGDVTTQTLAEPVELAVTPREAALCEEHGDALARLGFRVRRADDRTVAVATAPALLADEGIDAPALARDLLSEFVDGDPAGTVEGVVDDLLGDLACHPAVTGNTPLHEGTVAGLLAALDDCENPYACPHGRPTMVEFSAEEITERFERDYPGHGGR